MGYAEPSGKFSNGKPKFRARWQLDERNERGRRKEGHMDGFPSAKLAKDYAADQEAAIRTGTYVDPNAGKISVSEYFDLWLAVQNRKPGTKITYRRNFESQIKPRWGSTPLSEIKTLPLLQWLNLLNDPASPKRLAKSSINIIEAILNGMFALAVYEDRIRKSPIPPTGTRASDEYKPVRTGEIFTREEFTGLLGNLPDWMSVVFCTTMLFTGMRWSENAAVSRRDLSLSPSAVPGQPIAGTYRIDPNFGAVKRDERGNPYLGSPKSGGGRVLDLPPFLVVLLADWLGRIPPTRQQLFTAPRGGLLRHGDFIDRIWRPACDGRDEYSTPAGRFTYPAIPAACPGKVPHDSKHTNKALMNNFRVHVTMQDYALGHSDGSARSAYEHPTPEMRRERLQGLQAAWEEWAIDLTAVPAWRGKDGPGGGRPRIAAVAVTASVPVDTPALLQAAQPTLF